MRGYFIGLLLLISVLCVFGEDVVKSHEMVKKMFYSSTNDPVKPLNADSSCTFIQAQSYVLQACNIKYDVSCNDGQKMVDCAVNTLRNKCDNDMVKDACDNYLPKLLRQINSHCSLACSANSHFIVSSIVAFLFFKIFLKYFF